MSPGPWRWRPVTLASPPSDWRVVVLEDAGQIEVARLEPGAIRDQADARLIAAAPEMFAMLRRILECWPNHALAPAFVADGYALLERIEGVP